MFSAFAGWYYQQIPVRILKYLKIWLFHLYDLFSVEIILRTYFAPWKRDLQSSRGLPLNLRVRVWWMNLISRLIGAFIKTATLITFLVSFIGWLSFLIIFLVGWFLFPVLFILALIGVSYLI